MYSGDLATATLEAFRAAGVELPDSEEVYSLAAQYLYTGTHIIIEQADFDALAETERKHDELASYLRNLKQTVMNLLAGFNLSFAVRAILEGELKNINRHIRGPEL